MDPKQFQRFLSNLRKLRPKFKDFIKKELEEEQLKRLRNPNQRPPGVANRFTLQSTHPNIITRFLRKEANSTFSSTNSGRILPNPHHNAGLSYSHISDLTSRILCPSVPGRIFSNAGPRENPDLFTVGVGGILGRLSKRDSLARQPTKLTDQNGNAMPVMLRPKHIIFRQPSRVVDPPPESSGFSDNEIDVHFVDDAMLRKEMTNPYRPGSQSYVAHHDPSASSSRKGGTNFTPNSQKRRSAARNNILKEFGNTNMKTHEKVDSLLKIHKQGLASNYMLE